MGVWWNRKGENELNLVAEDELARRLDFFEIKRDVRDIRLGSLESKAKAYFEKNGPGKDDWSVGYQGHVRRERSLSDFGIEAK